MATVNNSDEFDYEIWAPVAKTTLIEQGLWDVVETGVPPDPSKIPELSATIRPEELSGWRDPAAKDMKAIQVLQSSLPDSVSMKTLSASSSKEVWDLLQKGNDEAKILRLEKQFEEISMGENESTDSYSDRVDEIILQLRDLKVEKSDSEFMKKLLDSSRANDGVATLLKELNEVHNMSFEGLVEYLFAIGHGYKRITEEVLLGVVKDLRSLKSTYDENMWMQEAIQSAREKEANALSAIGLEQNWGKLCGSEKKWLCFVGLIHILLLDYGFFEPRMAWF
ncbi:unnamed protein product [Arabis nemorensis]|uniref:DUF4219 domain-containing protein n=1 Tax=Arabis nemorensis TaxID=586526 RepID=A0A565BBB1_9BRAS|nr:unnamed protein product [Arabis nemorensis]